MSRRQVPSPVPKHDADIEFAVLGAILRDDIDAATKELVFARTVPEHFYLEKSRVVRAHMETMRSAGRAIDVLTLAAALRDADELQGLGPGYLELLFEQAPIQAHVPEYVDRLLDCWAMLRLEQLGAVLMAEARNGATASALVATARSALEELDQQTVVRREAQAGAVPLGIGLGTFLELTNMLPPTEVYIEGLLSSDGGGWCAGEEKLGKTYSALDEGLCLALARPVFGRFAVPAPRRVLFIEEEDSPRRTDTRVRALLRGHALDPDDPALRDQLDAWFHVEVWSGFTFDQPAMVARLEAAIAQFEPAVVYIDALRKVTARDLNKASEASAVLGTLDDLRRRYGTVFRVLHHFRKVQGFRAGRGSQEVGGSFVLGAWAEASMFFEPIGRKHGAVRVEVQTKDGGPVPSFRLRFETEGPRHAPTVVRLLAEDDKEPTEETDELVCQAIATLPKTDALAGKAGVTFLAVVQAVKKSEKTLRRAIARLEDAGRIVVTGQLSRRKELYGVKE